MHVLKILLANSLDLIAQCRCKQTENPRVGTLAGRQRGCRAGPPGWAPPAGRRDAEPPQSIRSEAGCPWAPLEVYVMRSCWFRLSSHRTADMKLRRREALLVAILNKLAQVCGELRPHFLTTSNAGRTYNLPGFR